MLHNKLRFVSVPNALPFSCETTASTHTEPGRVGASLAGVELTIRDRQSG